MLRIAAVFLLALIFADSADACTRCGLFGRRCRFAHQVAVPVFVETPVIVQDVAAAAPSTLVIQNNYNAPNGAAAALIAQPGNTVYGLQQAAQPYQLDPQDVLRQAAALTKGAQELAQQGLQGYQQTASLALTLNATQPALQAAIQAPQAYTAPQQPISQSITLRQGGDGRWQLDVGGTEKPQGAAESDGRNMRGAAFRVDMNTGEIEGAKPKIIPAPLPPLPPIPPSASQSLVAKHCASCHGLDNPTPKARLNFDAGHQLDCETAMSGVKSVLSGKMPKGVRLSPEDRERLVAELVELSGAAE